MKRKNSFKALLLLVVFSLMMTLSVQAASSQVKKTVKKLGKMSQEDIDQMAAKQLKKLKAVKKSEKNLKKAFLWSSQLQFEELGIKKTGKAALKVYGGYGFLMNRGDCNVAAYTFCLLARAMGYKAKPVQGYVLKETGLSAHAWVTIKMGKKTYVFDPNFSHEYGGQLGKYCGFKLVYEQMKNRKHLQYYSAKKKALAK